MSRLFFRFSAMNAGKSLALLQINHNYRENNVGCVLYTSQLDDRYGVGKITSRLGPSADALTFDSKTDFTEVLATLPEGTGCILIDEAQFLNKAQVQQLHEFATCGDIPVIAFGIRSDSNGDPFEGSTYLMALAEGVDELKNVCLCGKKATMNMRVDKDGKMVVAGAQIAIGGNDCYRSVCAKCFYTTRRKRLAE